MRVIGVTSYGQSDCKDGVHGGGIDSRTSGYLQWIGEEMEKGCKTGGTQIDLLTHDPQTPFNGGY